MKNMELKYRRANERVPVKSSLELFDLSSSKHSIAQMLDISTEGIGILTDEELQPFSNLEMWLPRFNNDEPLYTKGEIVWSKMTESYKYRAGVKLNDMDSMKIMKQIWGYVMKE